jgi:DNA-binding LytR/AlgR family response regulator
MRILICDNDNEYALKCKTWLMELAKKHDVEVKVDIVESWEKLLFDYSDKYTTMDLIYIEYSNGRLSGPEVAQKLRDYGFIADIVFNTNDESHIGDGYDVKALNYLIKGKTGRAKFEKVFLEAVQNAKERKTKILTFSCGNEEISIPIEHILYFEVKGHMITVNYYQRNKLEQFSFYSTLRELCEKLDDKEFIHSHKSFLISSRHIIKRTANQIEMVNGDIIPIGREYRKNVVCAI